VVADPAPKRVGLVAGVRSLGADQALRRVVQEAVLVQALEHLAHSHRVAA